MKILENYEQVRNELTTGIPENELIKRTAEFAGMDDEDVGLNDIKEYIKQDDNLYDKTVDCYREWIIDDFTQTYTDRAEEMLSDEFINKEE